MGSFNIYVNKQRWVGGLSNVYAPMLKGLFSLVNLFTRAKNTGAWKVKLFGIFQNPKPKEVAKTYTNIICTYLKNVYFY